MGVVVVAVAEGGGCNRLQRLLIKSGGGPLAAFPAHRLPERPHPEVSSSICLRDTPGLAGRLS